MERYERQARVPKVGVAGQEKLSRSTIAVVGVGGLGSVAAELCARAGVGTLLLADVDVVARSNLQRQSLYTEESVGEVKVDAARKALAKINSGVTVKTLHALLSGENESFLDAAEVILDCTDNIESRFFLNEYALRAGKPLVHCTVVDTRGRLYVVEPGKKTKGCLACLYAGRREEAAPSDLGVLAMTVHVGASLQVVEAFKLLLGQEARGGFLSFDVWSGRMEEYVVARDSACNVCKK